MAEMIRVKPGELRYLSQAALERAGVPTEDAVLATEVLVTADLQGVDTHGTRRLVPYINMIRKGLIKACPQFNVLKKTPVLSIVNGDDGLGPVVAQRGLREAIRIAKKMGVAYVGCSNSNHFGPAGSYAYFACQEEVICIVGTNAFPTMAPWGGKDVLIGNNPLAIGIPRKNGIHFVLDIAMSVAARGKIRKMADRGEEIPAGWGLDKEGNPTTDALEALKGYVLPIGGHKGYGLALAIDVLSGVVTGSGFASGVKSMFQQQDEPQHIGHFFIAINPAVIMSMDEFYSRMEALCQEIKGSDPVIKEVPVLLPGEIEYRNYKERLAEGIPMEENIYQSLLDLSEGKYSANTHKY
jgi:ureidoglycolate dehydrogenase (NAD+)